MFLFRPVLSLSIVCASFALHAQMPGWATIRDRDGNSYFVDRKFRIHTSGDPGDMYKPVSLESLEFVSHQADELLRRRYTPDALRLYKGIRFLSTLDTGASGAGFRAQSQINTLIKKEKDRFTRLSHDTALYTVRYKETRYIINDWMDWTFTHTDTADVLSRRSLEKDGYARDGASFGLRFDGKNEKTFESLLTVNAEEFKYKPGFVEKFIEISENKLPADNYTRTVISETPVRRLSLYKGGGPQRYAGYELFLVKRNRGFHLQIFSPEESFPALDKSMLALIEGFSVKGGD